MATTGSTDEHGDVYGFQKGDISDSGFGSDFGPGSSCLILRPEKVGVIDFLKYALWGNEESADRILYRADDGSMGGEAADGRWVIVVSVLARRILGILRTPMEYAGLAVDFLLNLLSNNGGILGLILGLISGNIVIPQRGTETFISTIGQLDGRIDLWKSQNLVDKLVNLASTDNSLQFEAGNRALMDLCMMASKLAYENSKVVQNVVCLHWKMHFVEFLDCWNDFQKEMSTQVFIVTDKPKDANLVLISFRGTEPFDADDWCTDFDYSWYEVPNLGKLHMGFIEALGLGNRIDDMTFQNHLLMNQPEKFRPSESSDSGRLIPPEMVERSAYFAVRKKLKRLFKEHKNAKFVVTGHSLGGALAIMFPTILVLHGELEIMNRLLGVYTFGQPRIGDRRLGHFMEAHLDNPAPKYFRIVYSNDLVPRLPYDDKTFLYKHFGVCLYYDSFYNEKKMEEEPNPNFYGLRYIIPVHLNAIWELIRGLIMGYTHGDEYREGWFSILLRVVGLAIPGVSAHSPTNYVNSVRLGPENVIQMSSF